MKYPSSIISILGCGVMIWVRHAKGHSFGCALMEERDRIAALGVGAVWLTEVWDYRAFLFIMGIRDRG